MATTLHTNALMLVRRLQVLEVGRVFDRQRDNPTSLITIREGAAMLRHPCRKVIRTLGLVTSFAAAIVGISACSPAPVEAPTKADSLTYAGISDQALAHMTSGFYSNGWWKACVSCGAGNQDWGDDAMTYALWLRWQVHHHDASVIPELQALSDTAPSYGPPCASGSHCSQWSDVPLWDSIALGREYEATGSHSATMLAKEKAAFESVDGAGPSVFAFGACPTVHYQQPGGGSNRLKTLETDSNYIKAALLLYRFTRDASYLTKAENAYAAVRHYFLDRHFGLYSVYVFDDGFSCTHLQGRFFASVNGNMIDNGIKLAVDTSNTRYLHEAIVTGQAVAQSLSDPRGVFTDLQAENDVVEPLVEGMYDLAADEGQSFAKHWLQAAASASASGLTSTGTYSRMFDGPANPGTITIWQANGGYALAFAEARLNPNGSPATTTAWANATSHGSSITTASLPASITFTGTGIALIGTLGERCCEAGHARILVDGVEPANTTGIWQNKSSSGLAIPNTVLFAWRWPSSRTHTITIYPGVENAKEGDSFVHIQSYLVDP
jgi:hypothetical protein